MMYKVFKVEGGWQVFWVESPEHETRPIDGARVYKQRQGAYRKVKQLNDSLKEIDQEIAEKGAIII